MHGALYHGIDEGRNLAASVKQALTWISTHKFADGTLGSTQATILAMRALLQASGTSLDRSLNPPSQSR